MSQGCWEIDVRYSLAAKATSVLYLPRTNGNDDLENGGGYPAAVEKTFEPKLFPCGLLGSGSTNACCIKELLQSYRTPSAFVSQMAAVDFTACPGTSLSSGVLGDLDAASVQSKYAFIEGSFPGMSQSEVILAGSRCTCYQILALRSSACKHACVCVFQMDLFLIRDLLLPAI